MIPCKYQELRMARQRVVKIERGRDGERQETGKKREYERGKKIHTQNLTSEVYKVI